MNPKIIAVRCSCDIGAVRSKPVFLRYCSGTNEACTVVNPPSCNRELYECKPAGGATQIQRD